MKIRHRMLRYSVYRNMFLSFLLLTSIVIGIVCAVLFGLFSWSTAREVGSISESMLQQNSFVAKVIKDQVYNIGNQVLNDKAIVTAMADRERDRIKEYHAASSLNTIQAAYPFIHSIGIYNRSAGQYINTKGVSFEEERDNLGQLEDTRQAYFNFVPRQVRAPGYGGSEANVLTFFLLPSYYTQLPSGGIIVININEQYVQRLIGGYKNNSFDSLFVMNQEGVVITHSSSGQFMSNLSDEPYVQRILGAEAEEGYFDMTVRGQRNLVSYVKSAEMNWVFVNVSKYEDLLFNMNAIKWWTLAIALIMFALSFLVSVWLTNQTYNPIRNLLDKMAVQFSGGPGQRSIRVNEFDLLQTKFADDAERLSAMESALSVAKRAELLNYFKGSQVDLSNQFAMDWEGRHFAVVLIAIDSLEQFRKGNTEQTQSLVHFSICNISEELLSGLFKLKLLIIEEGEIGILLQPEEDRFPPQLHELLHELKSKVGAYFKLSLTIGIGGIVPNIKQIRESYLTAKSSSRRRFFEGKGRIFEPLHETADAAARADRPYPDKPEKRLLEAIRAGQHSKAAAEIDQFVKELYAADYQRALFCLNQLASTLYKQLSAGIAKDDTGADLLLRFFQSLPAFETLAEISEELHRIVQQLCERQEAATSNQSKAVADRICAYVAEHYARADLSLEWMAGEVGLSRGYLGKLFKAQTGMSFNDYLNSVRMEEARELLRTDEPIGAISERVGIFNTTYFYTLFKKRYQLSPAQYRAQMSKNVKDSADN
ncbi:AraC family transcriptional regulator [Paenibacillus sp. IB182496]|uniref:AraC family transcriptional regulator n=1 Tax=Paenibacillus sabuli TaxID=2772509 RepID=A0A927BSH9_9BACL|nr:helix-turn-helix domain-containing protein [Paenibacillus sabuli]MBD2845966.1 AraC family transcriptional regulator [Paenibacillus sabuli]